jgi:hypothetical protein
MKKKNFVQHHAKFTKIVCCRIHIKPKNMQMISKIITLVAEEHYYSVNYALTEVFLKE